MSTTKWHTFTPLALGFKRYKCSVQYKGTTYSGWASNDDTYVPSIQSCLHKAFDRFIGQGNHNNLKGSSRTDRGVHAIKNVFQIDLMRKNRHTGELHDIELDTNKVREGLNYYLFPETIKITEVSLVDEIFDSRRNACSRTYIYRIIYQPNHNINNTTMFHNDTAWLLKPGLSLNSDIMQKAANMLIGEHDFSTFRNSQCQSVSAMRFVSQLDVHQLKIASSPSLSSSATFTSETLPSSLVAHPFRPKPLSIPPLPSTDLLLDGGELITITITANSFLLKMVRNIVGLLVEVGQGKISIEEFQKLFHLKNRTLIGTPAPPQGLYLQNVQYDN